MQLADQPTFDLFHSDGRKWSDDTPRGLLLTFEGGEGSGKTTQVVRLVNRISKLGFPVTPAREPGATKLGEHIRSWIKQHSETTPLAETFLFAAARAQLLHEVVEPSLRKGYVVVLDRYVDSTVAYQGFGRGLHVPTIETINAITIGTTEPDLKILLDIHPKKALGRLGTIEQSVLNLEQARIRARLDPADERRFETESDQFHLRIWKGYRKLARQDRKRWVIVRADQAPHYVAAAIWKRVRILLSQRYPEMSEKLLNGIPPTSAVERHSRAEMLENAAINY